MVVTKEQMIQLINNYYGDLCKDIKVDLKPTKPLIMWVAVVYVTTLVD